MTAENPQPAIDPLDDCPLPPRVQARNIACYAVYWALYYLIAPVSYVGLTHGNLLKGLGNDERIANGPAAWYMWTAVFPVLVAWFFPSPRLYKPLSLVAMGVMAAATGWVPIALRSGSTSLATQAVIAHGMIMGAFNGVVYAALWDFLRRGVSTSRRGLALGLTFGVGPLFACLGSLLQDALFKKGMLQSLGLGQDFPESYVIMFAAAPPILVLEGVLVLLFVVPPQGNETSHSPLREIALGLKQFLTNKPVLLAVIAYVLVYSGGNAIMTNMSLRAKEVIPDADTLGVQQLLRFGVKAGAGVFLGWLLATSSPRATLLTTTSILLFGVGWALESSGQWFLLTFGIMGAGELFGAYFPNYVATASTKAHVRSNMSYLTLLGALVGFAADAFGEIAETHGLPASFYAASGVLIASMAFIVLLLPPNPTPRE